MPISLPDATFGDWPYHRIHPLILLLYFQVQVDLLSTVSRILQSTYTQCSGGFGGARRRRNHSWEERAASERQLMELVTTVMVLLMLRPGVLGASSHSETMLLRGCSSFVSSFHV